jgi:PAS domain S-box-containing protein
MNPRSADNAWPRSLPRALRRVPWLVPAISLLVVGLALLATAYVFYKGRQAAEDTLRAVAELRLAQVDGWLRERTRLARLTGTRRDLVDLLLAVQTRTDADAWQRLIERLEAIRVTADGDAVIVLDSAGAALGPPGQPPPLVPETLRVAALRALVSGEPQHTSVYRPRIDRPEVLLDIAAPLGPPGRPPVAAVVLRYDPRRTLFPVMSRWPVPSASGDTVLWRQQGPAVVAQSDVRDQHDAAARLQRPLDSPRLAAAQVLRGERAPDSLLDSVDSRGTAVLAMARRVPGSDWLLLVKLDRSEVDAAAWRTAGWIAGLTSALLLALLAGARALAREQALQHAEAEQQRQAAQLQALQLLQAIADNSSDSIFAKDPQGRYLFYNRAAAADVERTPEQVVGADDFAIFPPEVARELRAHDALVLQQGRQQRFEERFETRQGPRVHLVTKGPLRDARGQVIGLFGVSRDMTEQRRAEQALRDSEAHHRSVIEVLSEGVVVFDGAGRLVSGNPAAERLLGVPPGALTGSRSDVAGWVPLGADGQPLPAHLLPVARVLLGGQALHNEEFRARGPNGQLRRFSLNAQPVIDAPGQRARAVVTSFTDITERHQMLAELDLHRHHLQRRVDERTTELRAANAQLAEAEHLVRTVTDNIPGPVAFWDRDLVCRFANRAFHDGFGLGSGQALGRHASAFVAPGRVAHDLAPLHAALDGRAQRFERESPGDGARRVVQLVHLIPDQHDDGQVHGVYEMAFDVTALKDAEAELLLQRDRAEQASRAKSAFLANMSHEIRTPMNAIIGLAHLVQRDSTDALQRERMGKLDRAARHLLQVINDILDLSKIEAGRLELEPRRFALGALLERCVELVADRARDKGLALSVSTDQLPDALVGDAMRLQQALLNLLSNAVKFTERGWVRLEASRLSLDGDRVQVRFAVHDSGPGIAAERQGALFTAFEQLDSSTSRRFGGTGLGLALTRHLAELMGGVAGVDSRPGIGSCFWFSCTLALDHAAVDRLPLAGPPDAAERTLRARHAGARVLLVEDNPVNQEVALALLRSAGLQVDLAVDGQQALDLGLAAPYALVLMDVQMPGMDGMDTTRELRRRGLAAPIVAMTANVFGEDRDACLQAGMNDHVAKPVDPERLFGVLLRWLPGPPPGDAPPTSTAAPAAVDRPQAAPSPLADRLDQVPGFDRQVAERSAMGQPELMVKLLRTFAGQYRNGAPALERPGADERLALWRAELHKLKGSCGAVGAVDLLARTQALEEQLRQAASSRPFEQPCAELSADLRALSARLAELLPA